ncbi:pentatricopeptide repeat-containing protein At1g09220, mitochondrial [Typha latifolia]|uniref:pentatricopeptide repeat-containing protein At1g09220, mitochondrial n=1 Tax=Typha latifolia TaxID=4733 RepID=UPI003C2C2ED0
MPWFTKPFCLLSKKPLHFSITTPSLLQNSFHIHLSSHHLLPLALEHQSKRDALLQIHSKLIISSLHHCRIDETSIRLWNTLIRCYSLGPFPKEAIHLYCQVREFCDTFALSFLLKACANLMQPKAGIQFHGVVIKKGFEFGVYVHTAVVSMYVVCGALLEAKKAFEEMPERNSVSWNAMITGFASWGEIGFARLLFEEMPRRNVISWTGLIDGYTRARRPDEAMALFRRMMADGVDPTEITVLAIVPAISNLGKLLIGESLHAYCAKKGLCLLDVRVENSLIDMYAKCGSIANSSKLFEGMSSRRNLVSWTSITSAFAMHGMAKEAVELFDEMTRANIRPNRVTFLSVLNACSHGGLVDEGLRFFMSMVYEYGVEPEMKHYGCIIDMLGRAGRLREAEEMTEEMPMKVNAIVWRTLLGCCNKHGEVEMGERVMKKIMELERGYGGDYVVMSNMLSDVKRFNDAEKVRRKIDEMDVVKVPGITLINGKQ